MNLYKKIQGLYKEKRIEKSIKYNRVLSFGDYIVDRWEKAKYLNFGEGSSIYDSSIVFGNVTVGKNTWIGPFAILDGSGKLSIGSNCSIGANVQIYTHDSVEWAITGGNAKYSYAETIIGNNCFIAPNVLIAKGVKIGDSCIIGANSFVSKDIPDFHKAYGNPLKIEKY